MYMDITGIAVKLDSRSALSPLASCYVINGVLVKDQKHFTDKTYHGKAIRIYIAYHAQPYFLYLMVDKVLMPLGGGVSIPECLAV